MTIEDYFNQGPDGPKREHADMYYPLFDLFYLLRMLGVKA